MNLRASIIFHPRLSLVPNTYAKFLPPEWNAPTPRTPAPASAAAQRSVEDVVETPVSATDGSGGANTVYVRAEDKEKKEWKRRIKMYRASLPPSPLTHTHFLKKEKN